MSDEINDLTAGMQHGFGSVRVQVALGNSVWKTSLFPSKELAAYVLPIKRPVRTQEEVDADHEAHIHLTLIAD